jgi:two-component system, OmpR family, sensor kinase
VSDIRSVIRRRLRLETVPGRLTFYYVGTLAISLVMFAGFVLIVRAGSLRSELDAELTSRVALLATDITPVLDRPDRGRLLASQPEVSLSLLTIRRADGSLVYRSNAVPPLRPEWERGPELGAANRLSFRTVRDEKRQDYRQVNRLVISPGGTTYAIQLMTPTRSIDRNIRELAAIQGIGILLVLALARYGSAFTARRALAPIDEIIRRGRDIRGREPGERLDIHADTIEIGQLVQSLNQMLERLEEPVHTAQRFAVSVSHELQTPIAAMRFALEAAQRTDRPAEHLQEIAGDLLSELDRLSTLIRDLRLLAIAGAGQLIGQDEPFDLGKVVQQCCEIAQAVAECKNIRIVEHVEHGLTVSGSALHLRRAILNLTDNAIRYSPPESTVAVRMAFWNGVAEITVSDRGCGISPTDLPRIFEQFFRADRARARETGGSGLGLAIASQIVRAHHGRIAVVSKPNEGSTFTIHLPADASPDHSSLEIPW